MAPTRTRTLTVIAQDPSVTLRGQPVTAQVEVPAEALGPGPCGYRVHVIDYDATADVLYPAWTPATGADADNGDPFAGASPKAAIDDPRFHQQNVYALVMRTLARFEQALGRRVSWGFYGHQLKVAPHAFAEANAFYTQRDQALLFGYFPGESGDMVYSCLSHDVVVHETTHALVDGLRGRYTDPSSPDQAAFHEGFADVVALLSVFSLREVVRALVDRRPGDEPRGAERRRRGADTLVRREDITPERLRESVLLGLAQQMGQELSRVRGQPLRRSAALRPSPAHLAATEYEVPHRRGEVLVAAMMDAFVSVWSARLQTLGDQEPGRLSRDRVAEEGADIADALLTMSIRALDYAPPVHIEFGDFLSALLTADHEIRPDDSRFRLRRHLLSSFAAYGIQPASRGGGAEKGLWAPPHAELVYERSHFESMSRSRDEVFRFVWENRAALGLYEGAYSRVLSVRPCHRVGPDGFVLREVVAECVQILTVQARELRELGVRAPRGMDPETEVRLEGGMTLVFDEYGRLKFNVQNAIDDAARQSRRLQALWDFGHFRKGASHPRRFAAIHRARALGLSRQVREEW
ncbi:MAG: hypothetical protein IRZ16_15770 [Myxococcaceae bacterium]|nr:hypothetical protein [Myxococcaceae bacterium]